MSNWRPDNWGLRQPVVEALGNIRKGNMGKARLLTPFEKQLFEAGADAMLGALKKDGVFTYGNHTPDIELNDAPEVSGFWCFIPKDIE